MVSVNRQSTVVAKLLPRVRGIRGIPSMPSRIPGTTSAYAENTRSRAGRDYSHGNYLRVRGEYDSFSSSAAFAWELPPRTRRIPRPPASPRSWCGTTSAYAENTQARGSTSGVVRNYLRVRGEYCGMVTRLRAWVELPPRTRRILGPVLRKSFRGGTTSAYAENTPTPRKCQPATQNYLRVRGEYVTAPWRFSGRMELPPRTRRIRLAQRALEVPSGTTSAYAENTNSPTALPKSAGNYLRVRGEYPPLNPRLMLPRELPPRTRRIQNHGAGDLYGKGTTSAYAENTTSPPR